MEKDLEVSQLIRDKDQRITQLEMQWVEEQQKINQLDQQLAEKRQQN